MVNPHQVVMHVDIDALREAMLFIGLQVGGLSFLAGVVVTYVSFKFFSKSN